MQKDVYFSIHYVHYNVAYFVFNVVQKDVISIVFAFEHLLLPRANPSANLISFPPKNVF